MRPWHKLAVSGASALVIATAVAGWFEGRPLHAYADVGGTPTICYGHTRGVKAGETATPEQCKQYLATDMRIALDGVRRCIHRPMTNGQAAAFADFAFNEGVGRFCGSSIARDFNAGQTALACSRLLVYDKADGKTLSGLVKRRRVEYELCTAGG